MNFNDPYIPREPRRSVGDTFDKKPSGFSREGWGGPVILHWTVIAINEKHRTYTAEALCHGQRLCETFNF